MKLCIPEIGTLLELLKDWHFPLHYEHRNAKLLQYVGAPPNTGMSGIYAYSAWHGDRPPVPVTLPKGTTLKVDRIYIRKGDTEKANYSSLSFWAKVPDHKKKMRFWAKLVDVNRLECTEVKE